MPATAAQIGRLAAPNIVPAEPRSKLYSPRKSASGRKDRDDRWCDRCGSARGARDRAPSAAPRRRASGAAAARLRHRRCHVAVSRPARPVRRDHRPFLARFRPFAAAAGFDTVYDRVHLYLAVLDALPGDKVSLIGFSFGGWLAAEVAAACRHRLDKLVLVDPLGIKISDRETPDILDIFNKSPDQVR